jgi:glyoxylase-like metal-dependent hydrolase (beta-lactamase superfamily II)
MPRLRAGRAQLAEGIWRVLADNPSPMTLDGTNSYLVAGAQGWCLVDPGPRSARHLEELTRTVRDLGVSVSVVATTHCHPDHRELADEVASVLHAPLVEASELHDDPRARAFVDRHGLEVIATPGHSSDSVCYLTREGVLLTGDLVLGRGTSAVLHPDGSLKEYLRSLDRVGGLHYRVLAPGHGPALDEALSRRVLAYYRAHRLERCEQLQRLVEAGPRTIDALVEAIYGRLEDHVLAWSARASTVAAVSYLVDRGDLVCEGELVGRPDAQHGHDASRGRDGLGSSASSVS